MRRARRSNGAWAAERHCAISASLYSLACRTIAAIGFRVDRSSSRSTCSTVAQTSWRRKFTCCGTLFGRCGSTRPSASTPGSSFPTICTACGPYRQAMPSSPVAGAIKTAFSKEAGQELFWRMFSRHPGAGRGPFRRGTTIGKALSLLENSGAAARWVPAFAGKTIEYFAGRAARLVFLPGLESFSAREPAMTSRDGAASATAVGLVGSSPSSRGATIASSSRRRWPTDAMPRSSVVKLATQRHRCRCRGIPVRIVRARARAATPRYPCAAV